ncbi:MAG: 50S ribosomal protein L4 [Actinomycetota bacterium]|nr:50S ribosomal protein L4 [Actinomycetota bacterium]
MTSAKAPVLDAAGNRSRDVSLDGDVFAADVRPHLVHEAVRAELRRRRSGTKAVKSRGMVAGGAGKPWRQKGTGRARAGTIRAPQFTGGGVAFVPASQHELKVNRKAYRAALRAALSQHAARGTLAVVDGRGFEAPSTREAAELLEASDLELPAVVVANDDEEALVKSFRNLVGVVVVAPGELEVAALVWARSLLVSEAALDGVRNRASTIRAGGGRPA